MSTVTEGSARRIWVLIEHEEGIPHPVSWELLGAAKPCLAFCPVGVYCLDRQNRITVGYQACVECGSCRVGCPFGNIDWELPRGGYGVAYKFG